MIDVSFISAKARVAPLKHMTIPRLELQGAVMASRLAENIKEELELKVHKLFYWTDSRCVLGWIRGDSRRYKQFVGNRVGEIQERSQIGEWRWVPTNENPADEATRSKFTCHETVISSRWFLGPEFLKQDKEFWPKENINNNNEVTTGEEETKKEYLQTCLLIKDSEKSLLDIKKFSSWLRLIRTTAWCIRFIENIRRKKDEREKGELKVTELKTAELLWIKQAQNDSFLKEIQLLSKKQTIDNHSRLVALTPKLRDGVLVLGGRINLSKLDENTKQPIILCPKHDYTKLLLTHFHEKFRHNGVETVLNEVRQKFWIINGRAAVKHTFNKCNKCKIRRAKPAPPMMGELPSVRLQQESRPFMNTGMDCFGPILVKIGRRHEKRWGLLFTCLAVRAIHLEIVHSMTTDSTVMGIMRFAARRGKPDTLYCDNGTNFVGASRELKRALEDLDIADIENNLSSKGIQFFFNCPSTPHMAGVWERMIGCVKRVISDILCQQPLKEEILQTFFLEAEFLVNSRPLTKVSSDSDDLEALTPNHFLLGSSNGESLMLPVNPDKDSLKMGWKKTRSLLDMFWRRFLKEYLPSLSKRNKWITNQKPIQVGDIVILMDDTAPRYHWKLGRITKTYPGPDQKVRVVDVKTANGVYRRPAIKLCLMELEEN